MKSKRRTLWLRFTELVGADSGPLESVSNGAAILNVLTIVPTAQSEYSNCLTAP